MIFCSLKANYLLGASAILQESPNYMKSHKQKGTPKKTAAEDVNLEYDFSLVIPTYYLDFFQVYWPYTFAVGRQFVKAPLNVLMRPAYSRLT